MKSLIYLIPLFSFTIIISSCKKDKEYSTTFIVNNNTKYRIENMEIQIGGARKNLSINPYGNSGNFTLTYLDKATFPLEASLELGYYIKSYSDSSATYHNTIGRTYPHSKLKETNTLTISVSSNTSSTDIFEVEFN